MSDTEHIMADEPAYMMDDLDAALGELESFDNKGYLKPSDFPEDPNADDKYASIPTEYENNSTEDNEYVVTPVGSVDTPRHTPPPHDENIDDGIRLYDIPPEEDMADMTDMADMEDGEHQDNGDLYAKVDKGGNDPEAQRYVGEFEDDQQGEFDQENKLKFKDKDTNSDCKCVCLSLLCFMALILAVAFGLFVALFYVGSLDKYRFSGATEGPRITGTTTILPATTLPALDTPPIEMIDVAVQIKLDQEFTNDLNDPSSPKYMQLEKNITDTMDNTFGKNDQAKDIYSGTKLDGFKSGSIIAKMNVSFHDSPRIGRTPQNENLNQEQLVDLIVKTTRNLVYDTLIAATSGGAFEDLGYIQNSLAVKDPNVVIAPNPTSKPITTDKKSTSECNTALGIENGDIKDDQMTASSFYPGLNGLEAWKGRLNSADNTVYWGTSENPPIEGEPWIQVDLLEEHTVTGIIIQGSGISPAHDEWVTEVQVQYGDSENTLTFISENNETKTFEANTDEDTPVTINFPEPIVTRILRIRPTAWNNWCSLRFEVLGCPPEPCASFQFTCAYGGCIYSFQECDGESQCKDSSDEHQMCGACRSHEFECTNGNCIDNRQVCNGIDECKDNSDEMDCGTTSSPLCESYKFACADGECIYAFEECDGTVNCADGSDEHDWCAVPTTTVRQTTTESSSGCAASFQFTCADGGCIYEFQECDGESQCQDGSDEHQMCGACKSHEFECTNGNCIDNRQVCNGIDECTDNSDEMDCVSTVSPVCESYQFACADGECIYAFEECDGTVDCADGSDEHDWCQVSTTTARLPTTTLAQPNEICDPLPEALADSCGAVLPYSNVYYPLSQTEDDAVGAFNSFLPFLTCHENAMVFVCGTLFPSCPVMNTYKTICRELCEQIVASPCGIIIQASGGDLPDCSLFPAGGDTICEQQILVPTTTASVPTTTTVQPSEPPLPCIGPFFQTCATGECIVSFAFCNGVSDCTDGSDEVDCLVTDICASGPCMNGGSCDSVLGLVYTCVCPPEFTGTHCEEAIGVRPPTTTTVQPTGSPLPCIGPFFQTCATGECIVSFAFCNGFPDCADGSDELDCVVTDICASVPCLNGGSCESVLDLGLVYVCVCPPEFTGFQCEEAIGGCAVGDFQCGSGECISLRDTCDGESNCADNSDESDSVCPGAGNQCEPSPCLNGGSCLSDKPSFTCLCLPGYSGNICELDIATVNFCASSPCRNGGSCINGMGEYSCTCLPGYTGNNCQTMTTDSLCASAPCMNGGTCEEFAFLDFYVCSCPVVYFGFNCETYVGPTTGACSSGPCLNGGSCSDVDDGSYVCACLAGVYTGVNCEQAVADTKQCVGEPCLNGGTCFEGDVAYFCFCTNGYSGANCEISTGPLCSSNPCLNGGFCDDSSGTTYVCVCSQGFTGFNCETGPTTGACSSRPCLNGGSCSDVDDGSYVCACLAGVYTGVNCDQAVADINECLSSPCQNGGQCADGNGEYFCSCVDGFTGTNCQFVPPVPLCTPNPCFNGGSCDDSSGTTYVCACPQGFTGTNCETDILECLSEPCLNGGTCFEGDAAYFCFCTNGYSGTNCEILPVPLCTSNPCFNGGACDDSSGTTYVCICPQGFTGINCETELARCEANELTCGADNKTCVTPSQMCDGYPHCDNSSQAADEYSNAGCSYAPTLYEDYTAIACEDELPYIASFFPNYITQDVDGFQTVNDAALKMRTLFRGRSCDRMALKFMCAATFPSSPLGNMSSMGPCRSVCEALAVKDNCRRAFDDVGIDLEALCSRLPDVPVAGTEDQICTFH